MKNDHTVSFVGSGNVATQLALSLEKSGFNIQQIYSKSFENAEELALKVKAEAIQNFSDFSSSDFIIVATNDDSIKAVAKKLNQLDSIILHTSGSVEMNALNSNKNYGVLYPLQTLSKSEVANFSSVPVLVEANSTETLDQVKELAKNLNENIQEIDSSQRKALHLAAVISNNFTNHMFTLLRSYCESESVDIELLRPLIEKTISSKNVQTGPAKRGDLNTINEHSYMLNEHPELKDLYTYISNHILAHYGH